MFIICEVLTRTSQAFLVGFAVDAVHQVEAFADAAVKHALDLGLSISSEYLRGIVDGSQGLIQLIEIDRIVQDMQLPVTEPAPPADGAR